VFIQLLLHDAEQQNSTLRADVNYMENYKALEEIKDFERLSFDKSFSLQKKAAVNSKLPTLGTAIMDPNLQHELPALKSENDNLRKMMSGL
jgi:Leucine zipper